MPIFDIAFDIKQNNKMYIKRERRVFKSMVIHTNKKVKLKTIHKMMALPQELKNEINKFWQEQVKQNPNLFNGEVWNVTKMEEMQNEIVLTLEKTDYAHYLYDERHGVDEKYACHNISGGVYILTKDGYGVVGELDKSTSYPGCLQVSGGGIDKMDLVDNEFDIVKTAERELKEELNLNLNDKNQISKYNFKYLEVPEGKRHSYSIILKARVNLTAEELDEHFKSYKRYLEENKGELEFNKLYFLKIGKAVEELDKLKNPKRLYVRQMFEIEDYEMNKKYDKEIEL